MIRRAARWVWILACVLCASALHVHAEPLPIAKDLAAAAAEAREKRIPILIAFTTRVCPYCRVARRDHLEPLFTSAKWRSKVVMLEMQLDTPDTLRDFEGKNTDARNFARLYGVRSVPTIIVFDADGKPAASPLVGLLTRDFYSQYIEQAMEAGLTKMRHPQPQ